MKWQTMYKMWYNVHNRVYCANFSKFSWTTLTVQEYDINCNKIHCMYRENMLDTVYATVQGCNIKLQHKMNF